MDDERRKRRQLRLNLTIRIRNLEAANCDVCPKSTRKVKEERVACNDCPIYKQLRTLGDELLSVSVREAKIIDEPKMMTMTDITKKYGVYQPTVYKWIENGLPTIKINKKIYFDDKEVKKWMKKMVKVTR